MALFCREEGTVDALFLGGLVFVWLGLNPARHPARLPVCSPAHPPAHPPSRAIHVPHPCSQSPPIPARCLSVHDSSIHPCTGKGYVYCGKLGYQAHDPDRLPIRFVWQLLQVRPHGPERLGRVGGGEGG